MSNQISPKRTEAVLSCLEADPNQTVTQISNATGIPWSSVKRILASLSREKAVETAAMPDAGERSGVDASGPWCEVVRENPCTLEDLLTACKVDRKVWQVSRHVVNKWEVGTKNDDGSVLRTPLFQIKAFLEKRPGIDTADALREAMEEIRSNPPVSRNPPALAKGIAVDDPHLLEVSLPDLHVGKLTWAPEVGNNYDLRIVSPTAKAAVEALWARASVFPIQQILLPIGNDFFNSNNAQGSTAGGTAQDNDGRWKKSFTAGVKLAMDLVEFFRGKTVGGVQVLIIPGNHDPERVYYLGAVLSAAYASSVDVKIDNGAMDRKYVRFGTTLLGFTHGHKEKHTKLPLLMAGERPQDWAECTHREWHLGHLHHARETHFHAGQEMGPVRVRILPSLCPADEWHFTSGYVGAQRAAEAYLWSFKHGYSGHLNWSPP